eukprot:200676-Chlamydomonas_euryale.AAC.10
MERHERQGHRLAGWLVGWHMDGSTSGSIPHIQHTGPILHAPYSKPCTPGPILQAPFAGPILQAPPATHFTPSTTGRAPPTTRTTPPATHLAPPATRQPPPHNTVLNTMCPTCHTPSPPFTTILPCLQLTVPHTARTKRNGQLPTCHTSKSVQNALCPTHPVPHSCDMPHLTPCAPLLRYAVSHTLRPTCDTQRPSCDTSNPLYNALCPTPRAPHLRHAVLRQQVQWQVAPPGSRVEARALEQCGDAGGLAQVARGVVGFPADDARRAQLKVQQLRRRALCVLLYPVDRQRRLAVQYVCLARVDDALELVAAQRRRRTGQVLARGAARAGVHTRMWPARRRRACGRGRACAVEHRAQRQGHRVVRRRTACEHGIQRLAPPLCAQHHHGRLLAVHLRACVRGRVVRWTGAGRLSCCTWDDVCKRIFDRVRGSQAHTHCSR